MSNGKVTNIIVAGLGGQGVIKASDILADTVFRAGYDVKKSEIHGMSQRGGSVTSDVRYGPQVHSPMVPPGQADFLLVLAADQVENNRGALRTGGVLITPDWVDENTLPNKKSLNVALLGALSHYLEIPQETWLTAVLASLPDRLHEANRTAFRMGCEAAKRATNG